jgi:hypothetical protein
MTRRGSRRRTWLTYNTVKPVVALIDSPSLKRKSVDEPRRRKREIHTPWERHITPIGDDAVLSYKMDKHVRMDIAGLDDLGQYLELLVRIKAHVPRVHSVTSRRSNEEEEKKANMYYKEIEPSPRCGRGNECSW